MTKKLEYSIGNSKLGKDTLIINMGPAKTCPSDKYGLCLVSDSCYAKKAERMYPSVLPFRMRQQKYWLNTDKHQITSDILDVLMKNDRRKIPIKYIRFNEAGDFWSQKCVDKLNFISSQLSLLGFTVYVYSARSDLNFSNVSFLVKGSGFDCPNGRTDVFEKKGLLPLDYTECPGSCKTCILCKESNGRKIAFRVH